MLAVPLCINTAKEDVDVTIIEQQLCGLVQPTVGRVHRLTAILGSNILEFMGSLKQGDVGNIKGSIRKVLDF